MYKMARAMYEYTRTVLKKVSFDRELFYKELEKALRILLPHEVSELIKWVKEYISNKPELRACLVLINK